MDDSKDQPQPLDLVTAAPSLIAIAGFLAILVYGANVAISARMKAALRRSARVEIWKYTPRTNPKKWRPTPP